MLNAVVCVKAVPDPKEACNIKIDPATKTLTRCEVPMVINPLDKHAMEAAILLKEEHDAQVSVVSMGPSEASNIVKECLALGADKGYLLSDRAFAGADAFATAFTLAKGIEKICSADVIFCGAASSDSSTEFVGPEIAIFLDIPVVTMVTELVQTDGDWWKVKARIEDGYRLMEVKLPAVFTVTRELNIPRTLSFSGIIKARKKEITIWSLNELGLPAESFGLKGSPTIVSTMRVTERKRQVQFITGSREEKAEQLVQKMAEAGIL